MGLEGTGNEHILSRGPTWHTHIGHHAVDEVTVHDGAVGAAEGNVEDESGEGGVVVVADTGVDPRTVVVHLLDASGRETGGEMNRELRHIQCP